LRGHYHLFFGQLQLGAIDALWQFDPLGRADEADLACVDWLEAQFQRGRVRLEVEIEVVRIHELGIGDDAAGIVALFLPFGKTDVAGEFQFAVRSKIEIVA